MDELSDIISQMKNDEVQDLLAVSMSGGPDDPRSHEHALRLLKKGNANGIVMVAKNFAAGRGVPQNENLGLRLLIELMAAHSKVPPKDGAMEILREEVLSISKQMVAKEEARHARFTELAEEVAKAAADPDPTCAATEALVRALKAHMIFVKETQLDDVTALISETEFSKSVSKTKGTKEE